MVLTNLNKNKLALALMKVALQEMPSIYTKYDTNYNYLLFYSYNINISFKTICNT
jgi:hypothetical protein